MKSRVKILNQRILPVLIFIILLLLGNPKTFLFAQKTLIHKTLILEPISFDEDYEYQFEKEEGMKYPQWEIIHGKLPDGIKLEDSGKLHGKIKGEPKAFEEKKYSFLIRGWDKCDESKDFLFEAHLEVKSNNKEDEQKAFKILDNIRAIIGFEQSAASSLNRKQGLFVDLYLNYPLPIYVNEKEKDYWLRNRVNVWLNIRLTSVPFSINSSIADFAAGCYDKLKQVKISQIAQAVEFHSGLEFRLLTNKKYTLNFLLGVNAITPIAPKESLEIFKISNDIKAEKFPTVTEEDLEKNDYVALVPPSRDKFFRQYYLGFRLKSHFKPKIPETGRRRFPATFDVVYGIKDTTDKISKGFFKLECFYPIKVSNKLSNILNIYIFGSILLKSTPTKFSDHLYLESAPEGTTYPDPNNKVLKITVPEQNRDYYRVGIGVDIINLFATK